MKRLFLLFCLAYGRLYSQQCYEALTDAYWHQYHAHFSINNNMAVGSTSEAEWQDAIMASAVTWSLVSSADFSFEYDGLTGANYTGTRQNQSVIGWRVFTDARTGGLTTVWYSKSSGLVEVQTCFNQIDSIDWSDNPSYYQMDIQSVATHEMGHWLDLKDLYDQSCSQAVMYYKETSGSTSKRYLSWDDEDGITSIYPFIATGVKERQHGVPTQYALEPNSPNPFNPTTEIHFAVPQQSTVTVTVYDALGREVAVVGSGEFAPGYHSVRFIATGLSSGYYVVVMQAGGRMYHQKMLLLK